MYRGICTIPDILSYSAPVNLPEDEVEGEMTGCPFRVDPRAFGAPGHRRRCSPLTGCAVSTMDSAHSSLVEHGGRDVKCLVFTAQNNLF